MNGNEISIFRKDREKFLRLKDWKRIASFRPKNCGQNIWEMLELKFVFKWSNSTIGSLKNLSFAQFGIRIIIQWLIIWTVKTYNLAFCLEIGSIHNVSKKVKKERKDEITKTALLSTT